MTKMKKSLVLGSVLAASVMSSAAMAGGLSGNAGIMSDYIFRGIDQGASASANGGVDYDSESGLAIGIWGADVDDGIEFDVYGSFSGETSGISYSIGFTTYNYTGDSFDGDYKEINLGVGMGPVSVSYNKGSHEDASGLLEEDYTFINLTIEQGNAYVTYGVWDTDADEAEGSALDGSYIELGYGMEVNGLDLGIALVTADKDLSGIRDLEDNKDISQTSLTFSLSKSFDL
ncbi:MAG: hypothetical protein COB30_004705 [Ectothiorhodospiraceae bacterium]|nr:hypothetical protein [Ectothiorhodospiraceae bacterium]